MSFPTRFRAALTLLGAGFVGVMAAHGLTYVMVFPNPVLRHGVLVATGHRSYASHVPAAILVGAGLALVTALISGWLRGSVDEAPSVRYRRLFATLAILQVGGFVLLEMAERLVAGVSPARLMTPTLPYGILLQILVASLAAVVLLFILKVVERVARTYRSARRAVRRLVSWPRLDETPSARPIWNEPFAPRAPPALLTA